MIEIHYYLKKNGVRMHAHVECRTYISLRPCLSISLV